jgi:hypothetical protein
MSARLWCSKPQACLFMGRLSTYLSLFLPPPPGLSQCKILGETLNTTVQTLVAGAFVSYMPTTIFWLR